MRTTFAGFVAKTLQVQTNYMRGSIGNCINANCNINLISYLKFTRNPTQLCILTFFFIHCINNGSLQTIVVHNESSVM